MELIIIERAKSVIYIRKDAVARMEYIQGEPDSYGIPLHKVTLSSATGAELFTYNEYSGARGSDESLEWIRELFDYMGVSTGKSLTVHIG